MESIYERYKEALKAGHVAVLRGNLEAAIARYREAATLADERALPHVGLGGALLRLGRIDEALTAYARALGRAPRDEAALAGRADALMAAGRAAEAAELLDRLGGILEKSGRPEEALRVLRRAVEFGETRRRRARVRRLAALLEPSAAEAPVGETLPGEAPEAGSAAGAAVSPAVATAIMEAVERGEEAAAAEGTFAEPGVIDEEESPAAAPTVEGLLAEADEAAADGDAERALRLYLEVVERYREQDQVDAALDACQRALAVDPDVPALHLVYVRLYVATGWRDHAAEKLLLLERLVDLDGDDGAAAEVAALAVEFFPGDPRFARSEATPPAS